MYCLTFSSFSYYLKLILISGKFFNNLRLEIKVESRLKPVDVQCTGREAIKVEK